MIKFITDNGLKAEIAAEILYNLTEWFGLPDSTKEYIVNSGEMPFWAYYVEDKPVGFIALKQTSPSTAEIYVMGILKEYHRHGIGKVLYSAFETYAQACGYDFAQVKTVQKGRYESYDITNRFYEKLGFKELECFPTLWDEWNPCQLYVKYIGKRG